MRREGQTRFFGFRRMSFSPAGFFWSGERRVGEKGRTPGAPDHLKKKKKELHTVGASYGCYIVWVGRHVRVGFLTAEGRAFLGASSRMVPLSGAWSHHSTQPAGSSVA